MNGQISYFNRDRGFGFVVVTEAGNNTSFFMHVSDIISGPINPAVGDAVEFVPEPSRSGKRYSLALRCQIVSANPTKASGLEALIQPSQEGGL
jgi:cold shock CspA family protein